MKRLNFPVHTLTISISTPQRKLSQTTPDWAFTRQRLSKFPRAIPQVGLDPGRAPHVMSPRSFPRPLSFISDTDSGQYRNVPILAIKRKLPQAGDKGNIVSYLPVPPTTSVSSSITRAPTMFTSTLEQANWDAPSWRPSAGLHLEIVL